MGTDNKVPEDVYKRQIEERVKVIVVIEAICGNV